MADGIRISALPAASTPLSGGELVPIVQVGNTVAATVADFSSLTIGQAVTGSTPNAVLFIDGSSNLANSADFTYDGTTLAVKENITLATSAIGDQPHYVRVADQAAAATDGDSIIVRAGDCTTGAFQAGAAVLEGGESADSQGGSVILDGGDGFTFGGAAIVGGGWALAGSNGSGGDVILAPGAGDGTGLQGRLGFQNTASPGAYLLQDLSRVFTVDRTYVWPDTDGLIVVPAAFDFTGQSASFGPVNLATPAANALYKLKCVMTCTTGAGFIRNLTANLTWNDEIGAQSVASGTLSLAAVGSLVFEQLIYAVAGVTIMISFNVTGVLGFPVFSVHLVLEQLS